MAGSPQVMPTSGTPQAEVKRYAREAGDVISMPPNTIHQHHNASADRPVRLISYRRIVFRLNVDIVHACITARLNRIPVRLKPDPTTVVP